jgi:hypothetical protein
MMTGIESLASRFQSDTLAGADNQYSHNEPVIVEFTVSPAHPWQKYGEPIDIAVTSEDPGNYFRCRYPCRHYDRTAPWAISACFDLHDRVSAEQDHEQTIQALR